MHDTELNIPNFLHGGPVEVGYCQEDSGLWVPEVVMPHNLTMLAAGDILAKLLGGEDYQISHMYFEFTNGAVPVVTPTVDAGVSYYTGLDGVNKDYIRTALSAGADYSASSVSYNFNIARFFGITAGTAGEQGLAFSQSSSSKVYGAALVTSPTGDIADDIVFARIYFSTAVNKLDGSSVGVRWSVSLT